MQLLFWSVDKSVKKRIKIENLYFLRELRTYSNNIEHRRMESKRLKTEALAKARELIDDHPFELKSFKIGSLATTREFIDVHPFQSISGAAN